MKESIMLENNSWYEKIHDAIINRAKLRGLNKSELEGYYEKHHVIPKCLGGNNKKDNLVLLTAKEHFIIHKILYRLHPDNKKLLFAVIAMFSPGNKYNHRENINMSTAAYYRKLHAEFLKGRKLSDETKKKISKSNKGKSLSQEQIDFLKKINTGRHPTDETRHKMSNSHKKENLSVEIIEKMRKASTGRKHSEETKKKISQANKNIIKSKEWCNNISKGKMGKPGHLHTEETKKLMSEHSSRNTKVVGPDNIIYNSVKECAKAFGIHRDTLRKWIKQKPEKGFKYY